MGDWRLNYQFRLVRDLGYKYMLQTDDDAFPHTDFGDVNLVEEMAKGNHMGGYCRDWRARHPGAPPVAPALPAAVPPACAPFRGRTPDRSCAARCARGAAAASTSPL